MERVPVSSSNIESVGYDKDTKTLEVAFHSGSVYQYLNVEPEIYSNMLTASSVGKYFNESVKDVYGYTKL